MVPKLIDRPLTAAEYEELAWEYYKTLPLEHFMESVPQATQRKLALESLDVLKVYVPSVQVFNELLIQYLREGELRRVVPDNMVRVADQVLLTKGSFNIELESAAPFWVLEWVSSSSEGKDYGDAFRKYEHDLKVPYCLLFHYEDIDLKLYRHNGRRYQRVKPNSEGRLPMPELDLEVGMVDEWVRFWYQGKLLPLPEDLLRSLEKTKRKAQMAKQQAKKATQLAKKAQQQAQEEKRLRQAAEEETARLKAEVARLRGDKQS